MCRPCQSTVSGAFLTHLPHLTSAICSFKLHHYLLIDLAVLVAGGFVDSNPSSASYGNFTVGVQSKPENVFFSEFPALFLTQSARFVTGLNLYDADEGIKAKLANLKQTATPSNAKNQAMCNDVLQNLFSACNPDDTTCTDPNTQSFALSTGEFLLGSCSLFWHHVFQYQRPFANRRSSMCRSGKSSTIFVNVFWDPCNKSLLCWRIVAKNVYHSEHAQGQSFIPCSGLLISATWTYNKRFSSSTHNLIRPRNCFSRW